MRLNTVTTQAVRLNTVTTQAVRLNTVTTSAVRLNTVTTQVNLSTEGEPLTSQIYCHCLVRPKVGLI